MNKNSQVLGDASEYSTEIHCHVLFSNCFVGHNFEHVYNMDTKEDSVLLPN